MDMRLSAALSDYKYISLIVNKLIDNFAFFEKEIVMSMNKYAAGYLEFGDNVSKLALDIYKDRGTIDDIVKAYIKYSFEYLKLQKELDLKGEYLYNKFEDAQREVYDKQEVMEGYYLMGLLLSSFLWHNHYTIFDFFRNSFLKDLRNNDNSLEIGVGHGLFSALLMECLQESRLTGIDISKFSLSFTKNVFSNLNIKEDRYLLELVDAQNITFEDNMFDSVICGEVLEHVESPSELLRQIKRVMKPGGKCFLTTAAYAASRDHIYLFHSIDEIRDVINGCGLNIQDEIIIGIGNVEYYEGIKDKPLDYGAILLKD